MPPRTLGILVSVGALLVALVHVLWPDLEIDAVTVVLLAVAAVPWLGPIFKSIELPGGWKFEYQQIQQQVKEVERRIESVERVLFTGDTTPALEAKLSAALEGFAAYLRSIDPALDVAPPGVRLRKGLGNAFYDANADEVQLDPTLAVDDYVILREYAHHVLAVIGPGLDDELFALESGLADYFVASYTGDPVLGTAELAAALHVDGRFIRRLDNDRTYHEGQEVHEEGEVWGAAFWELRERDGQEATDRRLVAAWRDPAWPPDPRAFARAVGGEPLTRRGLVQ